MANTFDYKKYKGIQKTQLKSTNSRSMLSRHSTLLTWSALFDDLLITFEYFTKVKKFCISPYFLYIRLVFHFTSKMLFTMGDDLGYGLNTLLCLWQCFMINSSTWWSVLFSADSILSDSNSPGGILQHPGGLHRAHVPHGHSRRWLVGNEVEQLCRRLHFLHLVQLLPWDRRSQWHQL